MPFLQVPHFLSTYTDVQRKWLCNVKEAERLVEEDIDLQRQAAKGLYMKERKIPPEVLGRLYAQYCTLINRLYDSYLNNVQLQRAAYITEIINIFVKRLYELREELVHVIVNDYIYVDSALRQLQLCPQDIEILVPYHLPLEARPDSIEQLLQRMWADAVERRNIQLEKDRLPVPQHGKQFDDDEAQAATETQCTDEKQRFLLSDENRDSSYREEYIHANIIQRHERFRQYYNVDFKSKCNQRRLYAVKKSQEPPQHLIEAGARCIQRSYREFMKIKRQREENIRRDIKLGLIPDTFRQRVTFADANKKLYEKRRKVREKLNKVLERELKIENMRLVMFKKDNQMEDITEHVREWFKEWYEGFGFFPEYPWPLEGGTIMVIKGDYPTVEEKVEADEKYFTANKGKTKDMLKAERVQAKRDALAKAEAAAVAKRKEDEALVKTRCNPFADPGYQPKISEHNDELIEALQKYRMAWSFYDDVPPDGFGESVYGYIQEVVTEDLMSQMHADCRLVVDELMKLDLNLLIKAQQTMYKSVGRKYPKLRPRPKPKAMKIPKPLVLGDKLLKSLEGVFDLNIISKPTAKLNDIYGDLSYGNYELNIADPDARFPPPGYGDIKRRLLYTCIFGTGIEPGAVRRKSVMLLGPERNGKSFLVDVVAGEMNAVKIDISPEGFSALLMKPTKVLTQVFMAAKIFQPAVIYYRNVERLYYKKVSPEDKALKLNSIKTSLSKLLKAIRNEDKIIFIGTCTYPWLAKADPLASMFNEIIMVPPTTYTSVQRYLYERLQSIRSIPRDYCVQSLAQTLQGYGMGIIIELIETVLSPERIIKLNVTPLAPMEIIELLIEMQVEKLDNETYQKYVDFFIAHSVLRKERKDFEYINLYRKVVYDKALAN